MKRTWCLAAAAIAALSCSKKSQPAPAAPTEKAAKAAPTSAPAPGAPAPAAPALAAPASAAQEISVTTSVPGAADAFRRGRDAAENFRFDEARRLFEKAIALDAK